MPYCEKTFKTYKERDVALQKIRNHIKEHGFITYYSYLVCCGHENPYRSAKDSAKLGKGWTHDFFEAGTLRCCPDSYALWANVPPEIIPEHLIRKVPSGSVGGQVQSHTAKKKPFVVEYWISGFGRNKDRALVFAENVETAVKKIKEFVSGFGHDYRVEEIESVRLFRSSIFTLQHDEDKDASRPDDAKIFKINFRTDSGNAHRTDVAVVFAVNEDEAKEKLCDYIRSHFHETDVGHVFDAVEFKSGILCKSHKKLSAHAE